MAKHIAEKRKKRNLVVRDESSDNEIVPEVPMGSKSPVTSTTSTTSIIPTEIVLTKSVTEEVQISDIIVNVSDTGANVNVSDEGTKSAIVPGIVISSTLEPATTINFHFHLTFRKFIPPPLHQLLILSYNNHLPHSFNPNPLNHQSLILMMKWMEEVSGEHLLIWSLTQRKKTYQITC